MANKTYKSRVQLKNDTAANWSKASSFTPLKGEMIVYSDLNSMKIGDGSTNVNDLPFVHTPFIVTATKNQSSDEDNVYTTDKSVDEVSAALIAGQQVILSIEESMFMLQTALTLGGQTVIIYSGSLEDIVHAAQIGNEIRTSNRKLLTKDDVQTLINSAQLLKKKIILGYTRTESGLWNVTNNSNEVESAAEDYMYLMKVSDGSDADAVYAQYSLIQNEMVELGTTKMSLDDYVTTEELNQKLSNLSGGSNFSGSYNDLTDKPTQVAISTSISAASTDNNAVTPKAVYDYVQKAITSLPTVYVGDTTPDSTFGNNGDIFLIVEE